MWNEPGRVVGRTSYGVPCLSGALGSDRVLGQQRGEGAMTDFEDHELAQAICRELLELRARTNAVTPVELSVLAAKAELPANWQPDETKAAIDNARTDAWLAICRLASETANNESRPDKGEYRSPLGRCYRPRPGLGCRNGMKRRYANLAMSSEGPLFVDPDRTCDLIVNLRAWRLWLRDQSPTVAVVNGQ